MLSLKVFKLFPLIFLLGCSDATWNRDCPEYELEKNYSNTELGFSINLPEDYVINENYGILNLGAVKESNDSTYLEACGVTVETNILNYRLEEFYKVSLNNDKEDYINQYNNFKFLDQGKLIINDNDSFWNIYSYGDEKALNFYFISNGRTYRLIFLSNDDHFDSLSCKFNTIVKSINFF